MPNDAEWALFIWAGALFLVGLTKASLRQSFTSLLRTLFQPKIASAFTLLAGWTVAEVLLAQWLGLWNQRLTTDTAIWYLTVASVLLVNSSNVGAEEHYVRKRWMAAIGLPVVVGVFMQLFVPSLVMELVLQPVLFLLSGVSVVAGTKDDQAQVKKLVDVMIAMAVLALVGYQIAMLTGGWSHLDKIQILRQFAMPVWLSLGVLPFVYLIGVYATYEGVFVGLSFGSEEPWRRRVVKRVALIVSFHLRAHDFAAFMRQSQWRVHSATSYGEIRRLVREQPLEGEGEAA